MIRAAILLFLAGLLYGCPPPKYVCPLPPMPEKGSCTWNLETGEIEADAGCEELLRNYDAARHEE